MKKQIFIILLIMLNAFCFSLNLFNNVVIAEQSKKYAQITSDNVYFYNSQKQPIFVLPKTFYCQLLKPADDEGFYYSKYINQYGFVKKGEVQCVSSCPQVPFLDYVNFRILASQSAELRSEATRQNGINSLICSLELYETNFILYGKMQGEEVVAKRGNDWFYCEYKKENKAYFGYVYAGLCDQIKQYEPLPIDENTIEEHFWQDENAELPANASVSENLAFVMPDNNQMIIIICISVPILLLIIVLLFMPAKINSKKPIKNNPQLTEKAQVITLPKRTKKIRRADKGKDFYELK